MEIHELSLLIPAMQEDEFKQLKASIRENGLREEIVIFEDQILDGRHRFKACSELGIEPTYKNWDGENPAKYVWDLNIPRRHLTSSQRAGLALKFKPFFNSEAKERQGTRNDLIIEDERQDFLFENDNFPQTFVESEKKKDDGEANKILAQKTGTNKDYINTASKLEKENPELLQQVIEGKTTIPKANQILKQKERKESIKDLVFPEGKYSIIYADPPWSYQDKANSGDRGANYKYHTTELNDLSKMDLESISNEDCFLFMWATMPLLPDAIHLIEKWGFEYKTVAFTWIKKTKSNKLFWGMGNWTRANAELCLLAIKGNPIRQSASVHSVIESEIEEHSKKPNETKNRILELCGDLPRIELFARNSSSGWNTWGNETNKFEVKNPEQFNFETVL